MRASCGRKRQWSLESILLAARANYLAGRFDVATTAYEQVAHSSSPFAKLAFFNASAGSLQMNDHARFLADYNEFEKQGGDEDRTRRIATGRWSGPGGQR